jgi:magnesium transporter
MRTPNYLLHPLRLAARLRNPPGTAPGTLNVDPDEAPSIVRVMAYGPHELTEFIAEDLDLVAAMVGKWPVVWVSVEGLGTASVIRRVGEIFSLHRLALEDVVHVPQRAKTEDYGEHLFVVARAAQRLPEPCTQQMSIFIGPGWVVSFKERASEVFEPVRERARGSVGRIRGVGADYLGYALIDAIVDNYFPVLELYGERLDAAEDEIVNRPQRSTVHTLHTVKRELMAFRRAAWPMRDALSTLLRDPHPVVQDDTRVYLRDAYDHIVQAMELMETYRDFAASLTDLYLSSVSNRMNEIMKVLTMFSAIFIPLSFIAGVYGMNFRSERSPLNMPELGWYWGYPFALTLMGAVALGLLIYFWRKGWIGGD